MNIGATIKKLRIKSGITQQQLAVYLNISMQTVSRWETQASYPDIIMLPILAKHFHVTVDYLLNIGGNEMKTIESDRLLVREWRESDAIDLFEIKQKSNKFINYLALRTVDESVDTIKIWKEYQEMYPIVLKETGKTIGVAGLVDVNRYNGYRELEVHLCDAYDSLNYMVEAHKLILDNGFGNLGISVVFAYCGCEEEVLKQAMIKIGFVYEGTLRKFGRDKSDRMRYSIIKDEYCPR